jgi:sugar diacid utilization regulator
MKKLAAIAVVTLLSGCAVIDAYLMKYDTNEYKIITEIRADAQNYKASCANEMLSAANSVAIADKTNLFMLYSQYQPHNEPVKNASVELNKIAQGVKDQYAKGTKVSPVFCKLKFDNIEKSAETIQKTVGDKPR